MALVMMPANGLTRPSVMTWWYEPPSRDAFSCAGSVRNALEQFVYFELFAAAGGGVALIAFSLALRRVLKGRDPA